MLENIPVVPLDKYQEFTETTAKYPKQWAAAYLVISLHEEVEEIARLLKAKRQIRENAQVEITPEFLLNLANELSDVMWYVSQVCNDYGIPLDKIPGLNQYKLTDRKERGVIHGEGSFR